MDLAINNLQSWYAIKPKQTNTQTNLRMKYSKTGQFAIEINHPTNTNNFLDLFDPLMEL